MRVKRSVAETWSPSEVPNNTQDRLHVDVPMMDSQMNRTSSGEKNEPESSTGTNQANRMIGNTPMTQQDESNKRMALPSYRSLRSLPPGQSFTELKTRDGSMSYALDGNALRGSLPRSSGTATSVGLTRPSSEHARTAAAAAVTNASTHSSSSVPALDLSLQRNQVNYSNNAKLMPGFDMNHTAVGKNNARMAHPNVPIYSGTPRVTYNGKGWTIPSNARRHLITDQPHQYSIHAQYQNYLGGPGQHSRPGPGNINPFRGNGTSNSEIGNFRSLDLNQRHPGQDFKRSTSGLHVRPENNHPFGAKPCDSQTNTQSAYFIPQTQGGQASQWRNIRQVGTTNPYIFSGGTCQAQSALFSANARPAAHALYQSIRTDRYPTTKHNSHPYNTTRTSKVRSEPVYPYRKYDNISPSPSPTPSYAAQHATFQNPGFDQTAIQYTRPVPSTIAQYQASQQQQHQQFIQAPIAIISPRFEQVIQPQATAPAQVPSQSPSDTASALSQVVPEIDDLEATIGQVLLSQEENGNSTSQAAAQPVPKIEPDVLRKQFNELHQQMFGINPEMENNQKDPYLSWFSNETVNEPDQSTRSTQSIGFNTGICFSPEPQQQSILGSQQQPTPRPQQQSVAGVQQQSVAGVQQQSIGGVQQQSVGGVQQQGSTSEPQPSQSNSETQQRASKPGPSTSFFSST